MGTILDTLAECARERTAAHKKHRSPASLRADAEAMAKGTFSFENARARVLLQIAGNGIASTLIVNLLETIHTDRNELALVVGRSRRLSKKAHLSWPKNIRCSFTHAMDITFQFLVGVEVLIGRKILITTYVGKTIFLAPLRISSFGDQLLQHVHLNFFSVRGILLQRFHAWSKIYFIDEFGSNVHILAI
jgi:hypothetical protein